MAIASSAYSAPDEIVPWTPLAPVREPRPEVHAPGIGERLTSATGDTGKPLTRPELGVVFFMLAVFVACWLVGGWGIDSDNAPEEQWFKPAEGVTAFAVFYVVAQAIERLLVPVARLVPTTPPAGAPSEATTSVLGLTVTTRSRAVKQRAAAVRECASPAASELDARKQATEAANWHEVLQQAYVNATTVWALGAGLAFLLCAWLDVYLLNAIAVESWGAPQQLDLLVTGLAIGGGTVPLHNLIDRLQKKDDKQSSNTATSPTPGGGVAGVLVGSG